jgi:hypothetical protein
MRNKEELKMKKVKILQDIIRIAEQLGDVEDLGVYEKWMYATAITEDGTKVRFDVNITKEEETDGN